MTEIDLIRSPHTPYYEAPTDGWGLTTVWKKGVEGDYLVGRIIRKMVVVFCPSSGLTQYWTEIEVFEGEL